MITVSPASKNGQKSELRSSESLLTDDDLYLFNEGSHFRLYDKLGSHLAIRDGQKGAQFAVWAPDAAAVSVIGDFNGWNKLSHPLSTTGSSGIWTGFIPDVSVGNNYKYWIQSRIRGYQVQKADPFAIHAETPPKTASVVWNLDYHWKDAEWMASRKNVNRLDTPISIYEMHLGSWMRNPYEGNRWLSYREIAPKLAEHIEKTGFTHVEIMPVMEHPFYGSWGYQCTGYFAPTSRYGTPQDFMYLVDCLHRHGIGVILDWVPSHFPGDEFALGYFDGTHLFEHSDVRQAIHPDWDSLIFNYGRNEVRGFLCSSAFYWLEKYHADGLRMDAVASMLYLDYSRKEGEWIPNKFGGRENLEAIDFMRKLNIAIGEHFPDTLAIAEESTSWPMVSRPVHLGGLGFHLKWDMGWMHDTLKFFSNDPVHRKYHHNLLTFRMLYSFTENFVLPLSHDEVVHGKGSLITKMPGDMWQMFANLRLLYGYMWMMPAKKMLFMGDEFGQWQEWNHEEALDWSLLEFPFHNGLKTWVGDLNEKYRAEPALYEIEFDSRGFEWIDCSDTDQSIVSFVRKCESTDDLIVAVANFTPVPRYGYRLGMPREGRWKELLNSDSGRYWGSEVGNLGVVETENEEHHGRACSVKLTLPPLGILILKHTTDEPDTVEPTKTSKKKSRSSK